MPDDALNTDAAPPGPSAPELDESLKLLHVALADHPQYAELAPHIDALTAAVRGNRPFLNVLKKVIAGAAANPKALAEVVGLFGVIPGAAAITTPLAAIISILGGLAPAGATRE
jgi:hypothetical protein